MKTQVITHRGLDPDIIGYYAESSVEAFVDQIIRGYGLEFDIQFTSDKVMVAIHDSTMNRITQCMDQRKINEVKSDEILSMELNGCHLTTVPAVFSLIAQKQTKEAISALHLKHLWQEPWAVDILLSEIKKSGIKPEQFIIFDIKPEIAKYIKSKNHKLQLSASVSHPYDIERYNSAVGGTLISIDDLIRNKDIYSWAWLDEWDLKDRNGAKKKLYTKETFKIVRDNGIKIALVTPEMHTKSPGLLGGKTHEDGESFDLLKIRLKEIASIKPDAVCTDHPDYFKSLI